jgi:hypothetical protein
MIVCSLLLLFRWLADNSNDEEHKTLSDSLEDKTIVYDPARQFVNQVYRPEKGNVILNSPFQSRVLPSDSTPDIPNLTWNLIWKDSVLSALLFLTVGFIMASILKALGFAAGVRQYLTPCTGAAWALFAICLRWMPRLHKSE